MSREPPSELWLISLPSTSQPDETWIKLNELTQSPPSHNYSINFRFRIPELKVGTLDQLVLLGEDLARADANIGQLCRRIAKYFAIVLDKDRDKLPENLVVSGGMDPLSYLTKFQWDFAKFSTRLPLRSLFEVIQKQTTHIDAELKVKSVAYDKLQQRIGALRRAQMGNLLTRDLSGIVNSKRDLIHQDLLKDSGYMKTVLVVVQKSAYSDFHNKYESLADMVVPRSAVLLTEDDSHGLFAVVIFKKVEDSFKYACKQHAFAVREFPNGQNQDEQQPSAEQLLVKMEAERIQNFGPLVRWLKVNFGEAFVDWIHLKALRIFVESVLRYGLPIKFLSVVLQPVPKKTEKLTDILSNKMDGREMTAQMKNKMESSSKDPVSPELMAMTKDCEKGILSFILYKIDVDFTTEGLNTK